MLSTMICNLTSIPQIINDRTYATKQNLIVKTIKKDEGTLYIIKYDKSKLNKDNTKTLGMFRSIITDGKKIISFSPQKSIDYEDFKKENILSSKCSIEKYIEGTMINVFINPLTNNWEISTRSVLGAHGKFFRDAKYSFREMFFETLESQGINLHLFDKNKSYSFVLQHKENKIVLNHTENKLYLTNVYEFTEFSVIEHDSQTIAKTLNIPYPEIFTNLNSWNDTEWKIANLENEKKHNIVGIMVKNSTGERTKIRNKAYDYVKKLKGNNPKMQFQYYSLRQLNSVTECLKFYPEYTDLFNQYRNDLHNWTRQLHQNYYDCFINKKQKLKTYPHQFKIHMWNLHQLYLNELKPQGKYMSFREAIYYVNGIHPAKLMYAINYLYRKKDDKTEDKKTEATAETTAEATAETTTEAIAETEDVTTVETKEIDEYVLVETMTND